MPKPVAKSNSAMDKLIESFLKLRAEAKERMSEEEFRETERKFDELVRKVRARRRRKMRS
ncbi:MAG: hypothetical protein DMG77_06145 [Acidobacteria bacterium]|nr:MAG: hypothetical protein DMG77_06145 [Acidobacteriota bacterium]